MAESKKFAFSHKEVAEALIRQQGIHKGTWGLFVKFGLSGANVGTSESSLLPAAIVAILEIGLVKFEEENNLSVDAAKVNPSPRARAGKKAPRVRPKRGTSK
jgi:hypothetical protein